MEVGEERTGAFLKVKRHSYWEYEVTKLAGGFGGMVGTVANVWDTLSKDDEVIEFEHFLSAKPTAQLPPLADGAPERSADVYKMTGTNSVDEARCALCTHPINHLDIDGTRRHGAICVFQSCRHHVHAKKCSIYGHHMCPVCAVDSSKVMCKCGLPAKYFPSSASTPERRRFKVPLPPGIYHCPQMTGARCDFYAFRPVSS